MDKINSMVFFCVIKKKYYIQYNRGMEQLVARRAHNPKVIGSSPIPAIYNIINPFIYYIFVLKNI